jgi:transcriptional regulator GlxA family with amidase domain
MKQQTVGILIFDEVEVLDFCGPFEVFAVTQLSGHDANDDASKPFRVVTIAERNGMVRCRGGLLVQPHFSIEDHPPLDILVVQVAGERDAKLAMIGCWIGSPNRTRARR